MFLKRIFLSISDRLFCVAGAFFFSQIPTFIQQYQNRLAGHVDELRYQLSELEKIASKTQLTLGEYFHKFTIQTDRDFHAQGIYLESLQNRYTHLSNHLNQLQEASLVKKPLNLITHIDFSIAFETARDFYSSIPLSFEGMCYIIIGLFFGASFFWIMRCMINFKLRKKNTDLIYEPTGDCNESESTLS